MNQKSKILLFIAGGFLLLLMVVSLYLNSFLNSQRSQEQEGSAQQSQTLTEADIFTIPDEQYPVPPQEAGQLQAEADRNFAIQALNRDLRYPWIDRLPISEPSYFAYYDIAEESLIVVLYAPDTPDLRSQVEDALRKISVPYRDIPVRWEAQ